ncbi:hypothetical protein VTJ04DRAFT_1188 [Mycothermus thermophilus]|uniref:uncharacterized protein n=1 Tax=Humicola insolens TaxID=85995 RepID=UPI003743C820
MQCANTYLRYNQSLPPRCCVSSIAMSYHHVMPIPLTTLPSVLMMHPELPLSENVTQQPLNFPGPFVGPGARSEADAGLVEGTEVRVSDLFPLLTITTIQRTTCTAILSGATAAEHILSPREAARTQSPMPKSITRPARAVSPP